MKNYILIILFLIIPSIILFFSNINDSKQAAIFLFIGGLVVGFLNYKKDKDERVMRVLNKWLWIYLKKFIIFYFASIISLISIFKNLDILTICNKLKCLPFLLFIFSILKYIKIKKYGNYVYNYYKNQP